MVDISRADFLRIGGLTVATTVMGPLGEVSPTWAHPPRSLRAAFGKVKITPEEPSPIAGYGSKYIADPAAGGVLDDLYARIAVLERYGERILIVTLDFFLTNDGTFPSQARAEWAAAAGVAEDSATVFSSHTHTSQLTLLAKYVDRVSAEIAEVVGRLRPVTMKRATGSCSIAVNRRPGLKPNFSLPVDRGMDVLVFENARGRRVGSIVKAAVHGTILWNLPDRISGDCMGLAMQAWEAEERPGFVSLFLQGFSGDVGPIGGGPLGGEVGDTYHLVKTLGRKLYYDIQEALEGPNVKVVPTEGLGVLSRTIALPTKTDGTRDVSLIGIRIGDLAIFATSLEVFHGYNDEFMKASPFTHTLCSGLANAYSSYLPTAAAFTDGLGGYEMRTTPYTVAAPPIFKSESLDLLNELHAS